MSEKLDGVRAYWDGKQFLSRQGNLTTRRTGSSPGCPTAPLDGELWIGRKKFQRTVSIVRRQDKTDAVEGSAVPRLRRAGRRGGPFEERLEFLDATHRRAEAPTYAARPRARSCAPGVDHLRAELRRVEALGGEGLMLRQPGSKYEAGRSTHAAEGEELPRRRGGGDRPRGRARGGTRAGSGRCWCGCRTARSSASAPGFTDAEREDPPAVGSDDHVPLPGAVRRRRAAVPELRRVPARLTKRNADDADQGTRTTRIRPIFGL